jgi:DNA-binding transcriptional MerR regulator
VSGRRLLSIGQFARITGLTVRALRHYDELGLVRPAFVDPETGYRHYENRQAGDALAVRRLREVELPLDQIAELVASHDQGALAQTLAAHRERMELRAAEIERLLGDVNGYLADTRAVFSGSLPVADDRHVPEQTVVAVRFQADATDPLPVILAAFRRGRSFLRERELEPAGPPTLVAPFADERGEQVLQATWPIAQPVEGAGDVVAAKLPACRVVAILHRGSHQELHGSYRALSRYIDENELSPAGPPRETYLTNPQETKPEDALTEVAWPVADET